MKVLIIIPAYNEEANIEKVVTNLKEVCPQYDYVVVNDGSKDRTADICRKNGFSLIDNPINLGLSGSFQSCMKYAIRMGYDAAIQIDGDGQHDVAYIPQMVDLMEKEQLDIVIGSRFVSEKKPWTPRMIGSRILSAGIWMTCGKHIKDPTSGMRLYGRKMLTEFATKLNYGPEPDTICYLIRCGAKVKETQVTMRERMGGTSYLNLSRSFWYMLSMTLSIFVIQWFRKRK